MIHKSIIITGDDFGISSQVNQAILQAHREGVLTHASLMVTGEAFTEAVTIAKSYPSLSVGLHLVLICGDSVLPHTQIPHLVDRKGHFSDSPVLAGLNYQFNPPAAKELQKEIRAQLQKFHDTGLTLSHVDGHLHLHTHPLILNILAQLSREFPIPRIRLPYEEFSHSIDKYPIWWIFTQLRHHGEKLLSRYGINWSQRVYGLMQTGNITEEYLLQLIPQITAHHIEIYGHPGADNKEINAFTSKKVLETLQKQGFRL